MLLKVRHITTGYGKKQILTDLSLEAAPGEVVLLTGGNGSGKSTALKTIYGLIKPWDEKGGIHFENSDITGCHPSQMIRRGIAYMPQKKNVFEDFTVEENLQTATGNYSKTEARERIATVYQMLPRLKEMRKRTPFHLSGGERQLLAFGNTLVHKPKLALLDEPFAGVDKENHENLMDCMKAMNKERTTFIVIEHKEEHFNTFPRWRKLTLQLGTISKEEGGHP